VACELALFSPLRAPEARTSYRPPGEQLLSIDQDNSTAPTSFIVGFTRIAREAERKVPASRAIPQQGPFRVRHESHGAPCGRARLPDLSESRDALGARLLSRWLKEFNEIA